MRVLGLESGTFRPLHRPEAPCWGAFWRGQRGSPVQGSEPHGRGIGFGSGYLAPLTGAAGKPRILAITGGRSMAAMIFKAPPHWEHCSISISNTRLSSRAQFMRAGAEGGAASPWSVECAFALTAALGKPATHAM